MLDAKTFQSCFYYGKDHLVQKRPNLVTYDVQVVNPV